MHVHLVSFEAVIMICLHSDHVVTLKRLQFSQQCHEKHHVASPGDMVLSYSLALVKVKMKNRCKNHVLLN